MIPCRLTGKPFWDIYLYHDPPLWQAYIEVVRYFGFDGWLHATGPQSPLCNHAIVKRTDERIILQHYETVNGRRTWAPTVTVYYVADPPTHGVPCERIGLPREPKSWEDFEDPTPQMTQAEVLAAARERMGDDGVVGLSVAIPGLHSVEQVYEYHDNYAAVKERALSHEDRVENMARAACALRPDHILIGYSGALIFQTPAIFRDLGLPSLQKITAVCKDEGIPSQVHCCGRERALVEICARESDLTSINPLERPPMGDCDLREIKQRFGRDIGLMGNLHTTEHMLHGTPEIVARESRWCIDVAAEGGGFILSTGDQCGRDTPDDNIRAMVETARECGVY
jgi:uroporphyrinogen decarboxylase